MKKFDRRVEKTASQFDLVVPEIPTPAPEASFVIRDIKFSQEEIWMVEWETHNAQRRSE